MNRSFALLAALLLLPAATAEAQSESDDGMASRHALELAIGGGLSTASLSPSRFDVQVGGQLNARAMVDLVHVRADASLIMPDPTRPEQLQLRGDARLLFVVAHDFTWRNSADGELLRVFGGLGGDIELRSDGGLADIAPTVLQLLNIPVPEAMSGKSLVASTATLGGRTLA